MDIIKHLAVFDPSRVPSPVVIVGLGALGSAVALQLAKLGLGRQLHLFDDDVVKEHNIANQVLYSTEDVGKAKVNAAADALSRLVDDLPFYVRADVESKSQIRNAYAVFVCVDSMSARQKIFDCTFCAGVSYLVEGRMGARNGAAYLLDPNDPVQRAVYDRELYPDSDVVEDRAVCGTVQSVITTASMVAAHMVWLFIAHVMKEKDLKNEVLFNTSPPLLTSRSFPSSQD